MKGRIRWTFGSFFGWWENLIFCFWNIYWPLVLANLISDNGWYLKYSFCQRIPRLLPTRKPNVVDFSSLFEVWRVCQKYEKDSHHRSMSSDLFENLIWNCSKKLFSCTSFMEFPFFFGLFFYKKQPIFSHLCYKMSSK